MWIPCNWGWGRLTLRKGQFKRRWSLVSGSMGTMDKVLTGCAGEETWPGGLAEDRCWPQEFHTLQAQGLCWAALALPGAQRRPFGCLCQTCFRLLGARTKH